MTYILCQYIGKMEERLKITLTIGVFIAVWAVFFSRSAIYIDPDFGWHIRMGQIILKSGIPKSDPLSYTMPSYPFVDHEWLTNLIIAKLYPLASSLGLAAVYATLATSALLIVIPKGYIFYSLVPLLLATVSILWFAGIRPQIETWFFSAIFIRAISDENLWLRWRFKLPILMILWTNLHGGFPFGIAIILFYLILKTFQTQKILKRDVLVLLLTILATFINPYGVRVWWEVWMQMTDPLLRWTINEWMPIFVDFSAEARFGLLIFSTFSIILVIKYIRKLSPLSLGLFLILGMLAISSKRHIPLWIIATLPILTLTIRYFVNDHINKIKVYTSPRFFYLFVLVITLVVFVPQAKYIISRSYPWMEEFMYPKHALEFVRIMNWLDGEIITKYGWGGYMSWKLPEKKVFIDGRMPSWKWQAPKGESDWAFLEYRRLMETGQNIEEIFNKHNITTVIWSLSSLEKNSSDINLSGSLDPLGFETDQIFIKKLYELGYKPVYWDKIGVILRKK